MARREGGHTPAAALCIFSSVLPQAMHLPAPPAHAQHARQREIMVWHWRAVHHDKSRPGNSHFPAHQEDKQLAQPHFTPLTPPHSPHIVHLLGNPYIPLGGPSFIGIFANLSGQNKASGWLQSEDRPYDYDYDYDYLPLGVDALHAKSRTVSEMCWPEAESFNTVFTESYLKHLQFLSWERQGQAQHQGQWQGQQDGQNGI